MLNTTLRSIAVSIISCFIGLSFILSHNAYAFDGKSGWWYTPGKDGTGVSVEIQGNTVFVALFTYYDDTGLPFWMTGYGNIEKNVETRQGNTDVFTGTLNYWSGWPLGTSYYEPTSYRFGSIKITFFSDDEAEITYTIEGFTSASGAKKKTEKEPATFTAKLSKFMKDVSPGDLDARDINGWWYDPSYNGMGFFMETRGGTTFMTWYHYGSDTLPSWWTCTAALNPSDTSFSCDLMEWQGGSSIGSDNYQKPSAGSVGSAVFTLNQDGTAVLDWSGTQFHLQRFVFGN